MDAEPWVCPWGICNHDEAQDCRAAPSSRDACGRRFPPGTTLAQAVAMVRPATDPVSRVMVAADKYWEASTAARQRARAELEQVVREALGTRVEQIPLTDQQRKSLSVTSDVSIPGVNPSPGGEQR